MVDSCDTPAAPAMAPPSMISETVRSSAGGASGLAAPSTTFDEPGGSSSSGEPVQKVAAQERKRKGREAEEWECQSEVSELTQLSNSVLVIFFLSLSHHIHGSVRHSLCILHWLSCAG